MKDKILGALKAVVPFAGSAALALVDSAFGIDVGIEYWRMLAYGAVLSLIVYFVPNFKRV